MSLGTPLPVLKLLENYNDSEQSELLMFRYFRNKNVVYLAKLKNHKYYRLGAG